MTPGTAAGFCKDCLMYDETKTIWEFLEATAARQPTPGGGSVTALVGALAAASGEMVVNYSLGKKGLEAFAGELKPALAELARARQLLLQLMVEDQLAYEAMTAVRKLPPDSEERRQKMPAAQLACIRVPEMIAATGVCVLERFDRLVNFANPWLLSDLAVAADLAMATIRCAIYSVRANLGDLAEAEDRRAIETRVGQILNRAVMLIQSVTPRIWDRINLGT